MILIQNSNVYLSYGAIQVNLGSGTDLNEKILRMDQILPQLEGMSGMLHVETWSETNTDIYFRNGELVEIPNDVQTVPTADPSTGDAAAEDATADPSTGDTAAEDTTAEPSADQADTAASDGGQAAEPASDGTQQ